MSPALLTMGMLGIVGLLVLAYFGKKLLFADEQPAPNPTVTLPVAITNLKPGTRITEAHLARAPYAQSTLANDRSIVRSDRVLLGRIVKNEITSARPISTNDLYPPGEGPLPDLAPGTRSVAVRVSSNSSAIVGQYCDVHFVPANDPESSENGGRVMTLFKGVKVLEMNGVTVGSSSLIRGGGTVKLELTPEQANIILLADDHGTLNLVYTPEGKGTGVVAVSDEDRATLYEILGYQPKPEEPAEQPFVTEMYHGGGRHVNRFRDGKLAVDNGTDTFNGPGIAPSQNPLNNVSPGRGYNGPRAENSSGAGSRQEAPANSTR